jgi:hypothetical protein
MTLDVSCPACQCSFKVGEQFIGKYAKCAKCGSRFVIGGTPPVHSPAPPPVTPAPPPIQSLSTPKKQSFKDLIASGYRFPLWGTLTGVRFSLLAGYFLGREHVKYEMHSVSNTSSPPASPSERIAEKMFEGMLKAAEEEKKKTPEQRAGDAKRSEELAKERELTEKKYKDSRATDARITGLRRRYSELTVLRSKGKITKKRRVEAEDFWQRYRKLDQIHDEDKINEEEYQKRIAELKAEFDAWDSNEPPTMRAEAEAEEKKRADLIKRRDELAAKHDKLMFKFDRTDAERKEFEALDAELAKLKAEIAAIEPEEVVQFLIDG